MKRRKLNRRRDRKVFMNTANRVHKDTLIIGSRGGFRI